MTHDVRFLGPDEARAAHTLFAGALLFGPADDERWAATVGSYTAARTLGVSDGPEPGSPLVATAMSFPTVTTVPGGAALPTSAVTRVGVRADRTRRGLLSAMMRTQLLDADERGDVLASLRASEARIYGRFGYGVATRGRRFTVRRSGRGFRDSAPAGGSVRLLERAEALAVLPALHDRVALGRAGGITRPAHWWAGVVGRPIAAREPLVVAVHTGPDGDDGFVVAQPYESDAGFAARVLRVDDLHAAGPSATVGLWRFLLDIDLVGSVDAMMRPLDEPLDLLLVDSRDHQVTRDEDETWLRILDVSAALAARSWGPGELLLGVHDPLRDANTGVYRLAGGTVERVDRAPALECDVAALGMAYLGDRRPSELAAAGWWTVHEPAALDRADAVFATPTVPWCGTYF